MSDPIEARRFSESKIEAIAQHLQTVAPDFICPACRKDKFAVYPHLVALPIFNMQTEDFNQEFYPAVLTVCSHCGHVNTFLPTPRLLSTLKSTDNGENT